MPISNALWSCYKFIRKQNVNTEEREPSRINFASIDNSPYEVWSCEKGRKKEKWKEKHRWRNRIKIKVFGMQIYVEKIESSLRDSA